MRSCRSISIPQSALLTAPFSKEGFEGKETQSLSEAIFCRKIRLAARLQDSAFVEESYQAFRNDLIQGCHSQVAALNPEIISVKLKFRYVVA